MNKTQIKGLSLQDCLEDLINKNPNLIKFLLLEYNDQEYISDNIIYYKVLNSLGPNENTIDTKVNNIVFKGDKKWETSYIGVYDNPDSIKIVPNSKSLIKQECIDKCREETSKTGRNTYVIIGKSPVNFERVQAEIIYKPSKNQNYATIEFIWR
jgi:hypothetical protein